MDVTRKNFNESLKAVSDAIEDAAFIAVDTEFTGLSFPGTTIHAFDTPETRYIKSKETASKFLVIQFGLAAFQYDKNKDRYCAKVFNFYIFPRPFARQAPDVRFTCQSSSLDFLASQGFDFNKLFREGIPYLLPLDEEKLKSALYDKHAAKDAQTSSLHVSHEVTPFSSPAFTSPQQDGAPITKGPCVIPDDHATFIENICTQIEAFLQSSRDELPLSPSNGYQRKLTYQTVAHRFKGIHLEAKTDDKRQRYILVSKVSSPEDLQRKEESKRAAEFAEIQDAVGFSKVIRLLSQSKKLIVGHNMMLDLLFIIDKFCFPLPECYEDFKNMVKSIFPRLLDTKLMGSSPPFRDNITNTTLADMHDRLQQFPFGIPKIDDSDSMPNYSTEQEKKHEAGYDAYITGRCFIAFANYLGSGNDTVPPTAPAVQPFMNKLFLMRIHDIPYMDLAGEDVRPKRDHVFHVVFPREWKASDISQLFSPYGNIQIAWLDESSALVGLYRKDQADLVLKNIPNTEYYQLSRYSDYMRRRSSSILYTPTNASSEKRKPSPVSDIELPRKKRRSSRESFNSNPTIPTIFEEEEIPAEFLLDGEIDTFRSNVQEEHRDGNGISSCADIGEPVQRKKRHIEDDPGEPIPRKKMQIENEAPKGGLFTEPDTW